MTITTEPTALSYNGDGATVNFAVTFKYFAKGDVKVTHRDTNDDETVWVLNTDYTLTAAGVETGGTLTATTAPATGEKLSIELDPDNTQTTSLPLGGTFPSTSVEAALDRAVQLIAKLEQKYNLSLRVPTTDNQTGTSLELPIDADRADKFLAFDADGAIITAAGTSADLGPVSTFVNTILDDATSNDVRTTIGLVSGGDGDIWVEKAGDTMTGALTINVSGASNLIVKTADSTPSALTHSGEKYISQFRNTDLTGNSVYDPIFPNIEHIDAVQGVLEVVDGSTIEHAAAISGYVKNTDDSSAGGGTNAVALFGCGMAGADSADVWGLNTLLMDHTTRATHSGTGRTLVGYEADFNVMSVNTEVIGISIGGNSLAQPTTANGFVCNILGSGIEWITAFFSQDGAATNGLAIGMLQPSGNDLDSQKLLMSWSTGAGTKKTTTLQVDSFGDVGYLTISSDGSHHLKLSASNLLLDTGQGIVVNGNVVLSDRRTGWTDQTATASRADLGASPTAAQLASAFRALYDDLKTHGMIGN